jgi:aspartate/tyrosine/aromatic aminotransferase
MFQNVQMAPPDPILGITEAFNADPTPGKINLSVGVYQDENGKTPILNVVKEAEKRLLATETNKSYKPITGDAAYGKLVAAMLLGANHPLIAAGRVATAHTPGGTGGLRVAGDIIRRANPGATVWISDPTWPNHPSIFEAAGLKTATYPYFDKGTNGVAIDALLEGLKKAAAGDVVLLHGGCHNPTGADPTLEQWGRIAQVVAERGAVPLIDFAYQGFAQGIDEDAAGLRKLLETCGEALISSSFSKNFGLYNERVGAMTLIADSKAALDATHSQVKQVIRANYSNPPAHGGLIVTTVLADAELRKQWEAEVAGMRQRINGMRKLFVKTLKEKGVKGDFSFIEKQHGMFSFSGLTQEQVERLKKEHALYIVGSGRINVAGMTTGNMDRLCTAIAAVS